MKVVSFLQGILFLAPTLLTGFPLSAQDHGFPFRDPSLPLDQRVDDLVGRLTLEEKIFQMQNASPAIPRLGIPAYNWWSECLHGVGRNGIATVFPQAIGMAATWNPDLIRQEASVIATEARAKYQAPGDTAGHRVYQGLTFYSPNINIFRDPRWGRGQETYGEDPFLTGRIGVAFVQGLQGNDPKYLKVVATAKHYAVHSGPESSRHSFDAWCSNRDLFDTYLPAFEALVREGKVVSVMGAYNLYRGIPCCANSYLLEEILRKRWGFKGYVTTDCGALWDIWHGHKLQPDGIRSAVLGLKAGSDLVCGNDYDYLADACKAGFVSKGDIDRSVTRLFEARFRLGMFDPPGLVPWAGIPPDSNNTAANRRLALQVARESMVLLKNDGHALPLSQNLTSIAVVGPYADMVSVLLGNYNGDPENPVTLLQGIRNRAGTQVQVRFAPGVQAPEASFLEGSRRPQGNAKLRKEALEAARQSDVIIFTGGISPLLEGEELQVKIPGFSGGDRTTLDLPTEQSKLLASLAATGKPVILVLTNGSALSIGKEAKDCAAVVEAWYPGEEGGNALADILFGDVNPAGRLPVTFYRSVLDLPPFESYSMQGRTYRYFHGEVLYPFGYGLSYSSFEYEKAETDRDRYSAGDTIRVSVTVKNVSNRDGEEVIQVYVKGENADSLEPVRTLAGFSRIAVAAGRDRTVTLAIPVQAFRLYNQEWGEYRVEPGDRTLEIGSSSADIRLRRIISVHR